MKKITAKKFWTIVKEYLFLTVAALLNAVSLYTFVNPSHLIAGGFSGLASALTYVIELIPAFGKFGYDSLMSVVYFIMNIPLLVLSIIYLRGDFTFKTIWATIMCTLFLEVLPYFPNFKFTESRLIAVIFGGIIIGLSMYIASEQNGSNGGTEIIAKMVAKRHPEIDLSNILLFANVFIAMLGSVIVMTIKGESFDVIPYSFLFIFLGANVLGVFKRGFNHPQKYMIVTTEYEQIAADITKYFKRGCTCVDVVNPDPNMPPRKIVMVVVQYRHRLYLNQLIKKRDPSAFTFVKDVHDVFSRPTFNRSYKIK